MDLIERQAAIDELNVDMELLRRALDDTDLVGAEREKFEWGLGLIESCISDIEDLPSAQPERKRGKWKQGYCSECGYNWGKDAPLASVPDFCPGCGVEMKGEEDE